MQIYSSPTDDSEYFPAVSTASIDTEPLFYNSRPHSRTSATTVTNTYEPIIAANAHHHHHHSHQPGSTASSHVGYANAPVRKRSLERQTTLYDDEAYDDEDDQCDLGEANTYYDAVQDTADDHQQRQWDLGGRGTSMTKILPRVPIKHSGSCNDDLIYQQNVINQQPYVGSFGGGAVQLPATPMLAALLAASTPAGGPKKQRLLPQPIKPNPVPVHPRLLPNMPSPTILRRGETDYCDQVSEMILQIFKHQFNNISIEKELGYTSSNSFRYRASSEMKNYNEDYNYAYHSTDSLNHGYGDGLTVGVRRKGATLPMPPSQSASKMQKINNGSTSFGYQSNSLDLDGTVEGSNWNQRPNNTR